MSYKKAFLSSILLNMLIAFCSLLYVFFKCDGTFSLGADLNEEFIPYMMLANDCIKSNSLGWNWSIDIGGSLLTCFGLFICSPFFLISTLFPSELFPLLVFPLYILKYTIAGLFAFIYLAKFVKSDCAVVGSILYAFSGLSVCVLSYFFFLDSIALFPLMLIALEDLFKNKHTGFFAFAVFINAITCYMFFVGQCFFIVLYAFIRCDTLKKIKDNFFKVFFEALIGTGMSAFLLLPCLNAVLNMERVGDTLAGKKLLLYSDPLKYLQILKNFLLPSESMHPSATFFKADYSSCAGYLPFFGLTLVILFFVNRKKLCTYSWLHKLLTICLVILLVPCLNNLPMGLNSFIYHRWLYMPLLMMALASSVVLEKREELSYKKTLGILLTFTFLFICFLIFAEKKNPEFWIYDHQQFWILNIIGFSGMLLTILLWTKRKSKYFFHCIIGMVSLYSCVVNCYSSYITYTVNTQLIGGQDLYSKVLAAQNINNPDEGYRFWSIDNQLTAPGHLNASGCFYDAIESSIFELYRAWGIGRGVGTPYMPDEHYDLFSAKYYITSTPEKKEPLQSLTDNSGVSYYVYEKEYSVPIGWSYDSYITQSEYESVNLNTDYDLAALIMIHTLVIPDELESQISKVLSHTELTSLYSLSMEQEFIDLEQHRTECSRIFQRDSKGFYSEIVASKDKYAFFSVPYSPGWTAVVNDCPVEIVSICGLMAIPINEGLNQISFSYQTPFFHLGLVCSFMSLTLLIGYISYNNKIFNKKVIQ